MDLGVISQKGNPLDYGLLGTTIVEVIYGTDNQGPLNDAALVGWNGLQQPERGPYLDLQNGQYVNGQIDSVPATLPNARKATKLRIEIDADANETRFYQEGAVNDEVTLNGVSQRGDSVLHIDPGGNADTVFITYARYTFDQ
ncbi:hypothetical protein [Halococcus salsus]|uniref:hypothetical protein n=1 Tax=Halococcus salsus TaxID=2162894 RepID=UPI00135B3588|nr:hypothetical protein [Halococcus salsus]